jgi:hypothetical protein
MEHQTVTIYVSPEVLVQRGMMKVRTGITESLRLDLNIPIIAFRWTGWKQPVFHCLN